MHNKPGVSSTSCVSVLCNSRYQTERLNEKTSCVSLAPTPLPRPPLPLRTTRQVSQDVPGCYAGYNAKPLAGFPSLLLAMESAICYLVYVLLLVERPTTVVVWYGADHLARSGNKISSPLIRPIFFRIGLVSSNAACIDRWQRRRRL